MIITPLIVGFIAGIIYGCSFVLQQRSMFISNHNSGRAQLLFLIAVRFAVLVGTVWYLLRTPGIQSILIIMPFIIAFWLVILLRKVALYERHRTDNR